MGKTWKLQEARDHFIEVVRRAESEGAQTITVRGREKAVVISCEEYRRMRAGSEADEAERTGKDLIEFFRNSQLYGLELEIERDRPIRLQFPR